MIQHTTPLYVCEIPRKYFEGAKVGGAHWLKTALVGAAKVRKRGLLPAEGLVCKLVWNTAFLLQWASKKVTGPQVSPSLRTSAEAYHWMKEPQLGWSLVVIPAMWSVPCAIVNCEFS